MERGPMGKCCGPKAVSGNGDSALEYSAKVPTDAASAASLRVFAEAVESTVPERALYGSSTEMPTRQNARMPYG